MEDILRESIQGVWLTGVILSALAGSVVALLALGVDPAGSLRSD